ncbi:MAG: hypothetical protein KAR40_04695 [Candidatus Sabulitectum sp.]|nr:hypothetical protein [Candidatus Sabulitectum sp.]
MSTHAITFQNALDAVESLPEYQQEDLIERRREILSDNIFEAREEYDRGEVRRGTVEDLMKEISE